MLDAWEAAPPRLALGDPLGGTGGGTLCFCEPFNTAGNAMSGSDAAVVVLADDIVTLAAVDTGDVTDIGVICAVTSDKETGDRQKRSTFCIGLLIIQ